MKFQKLPSQVKRAFTHRPYKNLRDFHFVMVVYDWSSQSMSNIRENNFNCVRCTRKYYWVRFKFFVSRRWTIEFYFWAWNQFSISRWVSHPLMLHISRYICNKYWAISSFFYPCSLGCHKTKSFLHIHINTRQPFRFYIYYLLLFLVRICGRARESKKIGKSTSTNWYNAKIDAQWNGTKLIKVIAFWPSDICFISDCENMVHVSVCSWLSIARDFANKINIIRKICLGMMCIYVCALHVYAENKYCEFILWLDKHNYIKNWEVFVRNIQILFNFYYSNT